MNLNINKIKLSEENLSHTGGKVDVTFRLQETDFGGEGSSEMAERMKIIKKGPNMDTPK